MQNISFNADNLLLVRRRVHLLVQEALLQVAAASELFLVLDCARQHATVQRQHRQGLLPAVGNGKVHGVPHHTDHQHRDQQDNGPPLLQRPAERCKLLLFIAVLWVLKKFKRLLKTVK